MEILLQPVRTHTLHRCPSYKIPPCKSPSWHLSHCRKLLIFDPPLPQQLSESHSVMSDSLQLHELYSPWNSPSQNPGVGSVSLCQGIFPTQGLNPGLPHCRRILYQLRREGSPFNWRIIALQNFVVFCQTSTWINHRYTYIPSLLKLPPIWQEDS